MSRFRVFEIFNTQDLIWKQWRKRLDSTAVERLDKKGRIHRVLDSLAKERSLKFKEVLESFEIYACIRKRVKRDKIADICCGHGLTGLLFAIFSEHVQEVLLWDHQQSNSAKTVYKLLVSEFPEIESKVSWRVSALDSPPKELKSDFALVAVHACGKLTDQCLDLALTGGNAIVVVPCCYTGTGKTEPYALKKSLGVSLSTDIGRTYRLENEDYRVEWDSIPPQITPMNRVILAHPKP